MSFLILFLIYVVSSKCSLNHFNSEKYKRVQLYKLLFLENSPLVKIYTSACERKFVGIILSSHFVKTFSALLSQSNDVIGIQKRRPVNADFIKANR